MAALILEITSRHGSHYHPIDKAVTRVGRALDNDIIVTDPTVSAYHFLIRQTADGGHELLSIADENGIRIGRRTVDGAVGLDSLPLTFEAGRTRFNILDRSQPVAATRLISCREGSACVFGHWSWAFALFALLLVFSAYENYLSTPRILNWDTYWSDQLTLTGTAVGLALGLLLINRLTSHRWDFAASLSFTSLILIVSFLFDQALSFTDYFFTSELPGLLANLAWAGLLLPLATAWFLIRLNHGNHVLAWMLVVALFTTPAYLQFKALATEYDLFDEFSKKTHYSNALYPWDIRLPQTISIDEFAANNLLTEPTEQDQ